MLYSYSKGPDTLDVEAMFDHDRNEFFIKFRRGDESHHVEWFKDEIAFRSRLEAIDHELNLQQWHRVHPPLLKAGAWKI